MVKFEYSGEGWLFGLWGVEIFHFVQDDSKHCHPDRA